MARCVIVGAGELDSNFLENFPWHENDYIICADGGLYHAQRAGIHPDLLIGDQDSFVEGFPKGIPALTCRPGEPANGCLRAGAGRFCYDRRSGQHDYHAAGRICFYAADGGLLSFRFFLYALL